MSDSDRDLGGAELGDHALQLFGTGERARGGKIGAVFDAYMLRLGHTGVHHDPIFNGEDWVFDDLLPSPGTVPFDIYTSAPDHGELFLRQIRQGARTGLACDPRGAFEPIREYGYPASLDLTHVMIENQKWIDSGARSDWQPDERVELHDQAWVRGADIFMPALDGRGRPICILDGAEPISFERAWGLLRAVAVFCSLIPLAATAMADRVPRDGTGGRTRLPIDTWGDGTTRIDFRRNLLFVPSYDRAEPWVARLEDIWLLERELHAGDEPGQEVTEASGFTVGTGSDGLTFESLGEQRPEPREHHFSSSKAYNECFLWLQSKRAAGPSGQAKRHYLQIAQKKFDALSERSFNRAWANALGDDARWIRAGRKRKTATA